ncbi:proline iminopeptidase-family hydrolase [Flaviaesturariibacter aridisoli]|uniref:Alpha/beta fold hydrolase n=1 Tax=Flaviaesturariibacter aridisoli TaxID=2545761 RepID=A0A4R4E3L5_9BACT|nr:proline iminopeptidase-family hydrolase [Flaviaesturariibacter aridisoli]TCZ74116.1 alpha/beta fold hydrolase [Flaviaesturariibacter aridisoli]
MRHCYFFVLALLLYACTPTITAGDRNESDGPTVREYFNYGDTGVQTAGIRLIPIQTPGGTFNVWTKRFGNNPRIKVLLLHGGPSFTHEYMECFESFFPREGFEFYEYDQLGSYYSDQPKDSSLWTTERFVEEVEQVRKAIGADSSNFYVLGNSWGGMLGMEYALKYQQHMKGLIVANMVASIPDYVQYANNVLAPQMDSGVLAEIRAIEAKHDFDNPRYEELLGPNFYAQHICRINPMPEPVLRSFRHHNKEIYTMMQGPSEFGASGRLANWDRKADLKNINVPTLMVGARYDTMDPKVMEEQSKQVKNGSYLYCPNGSHMAMWDDQKVFMTGVIDWIRKVDAGK